MLASIPSATLLGVDGHPVTVEVHVTVGLPGFTIVGLPDTACRESRDRVRAALTTSGIGWPNQKITINLAPSGVRKIGAGLDLAIAVGLLVAAGDGARGGGRGAGLRRRARPRRHDPLGARHVVARRRARLSRRVVVAPSAYHEATLLSRCKVHRRVDAQRAVRRARSACSRGPRRRRAPIRRRSNRRPISPTCAASPWPASRSRSRPPATTTCCSSGRPARARRCWPDGCPACCRRSTASSRSSRPASTRPPVSVAPTALVQRPPFRAPHHGASSVSLVGGGSDAIRPGEVEPRARRRALLRRARRVPADRARRAPSAARRRGHPCRSRRRARRAAGAVRARRGDEPVSVR